MSVNRKGGPWEGGYISLGKAGRETYYIEREVGGDRYHVSTRCHTRRGAWKQLERFEANPDAYRPQGDGGSGAGIALTATLVEEFRDWSIQEKKNTTKHANEMCRLLAQWMVDLGSKDLRHVSLRELKEAVAARKVRTQHRIIAIKSFYAWLRKERALITNREDPTLDFPVPVPRAEKQRRRKVVERERLYGALEHLQGPMRDCLLLLLATGWHVTELARFVRGGEIVKSASSQLAVLVTQHKSGDPTRTPIQHPEHLAAAERLRARRKMPSRLRLSIHAACKAADVKEFGPGVMRHTVATMAIEGGARPAEVSEFLGHKDPKTTRRFYIDVAAPTVTVPVLRVAR